ncbi:MAG: hypothetical protein LQ346_002993 [Caloplaca aetnensis]|nr:MAG: hypothetical protein LQ346_002993 [Caloplaca aetnensis]
MSFGELPRKAAELSDVELALLLSVVANEHCLIQTEQAALDSLGQELHLAATSTFGRTPALLACREDTTLDEFTNGLLVQSVESEPYHGTSDADTKKRIYTRTAVFTAPKDFCVAIIQNIMGPPLNNHLLDHIFMSHYHDTEDGFVNLAATSAWNEDDGSSSSSVVRTSVFRNPINGVDRTFTKNDIRNVIRQSRGVTVTAEVKCYLQNIVTFLRLHRAVDGGITPRATKYFDTLVTCLAPLHGLQFVTPSLVDLAARKVYPHRIVLTIPDRERSLQYGSDLAAVSAYLEDVTPESIVEEVIKSVETPL